LSQAWTKEKKKKREGNISNPFLKKQLSMRRLAIEALVTAEDTLTTQPGLADHAAQSTALVRGALVAEEHGTRLNSPFSRVIEHTNISIKADNQVTLVRLQANLGSSVGTAETDNVLEGVLGVLVFGRRGQALATAEVCPQDGQAQSNGRNAAPGREEVTTLLFLAAGAVTGDMAWKHLQVWRAGGVVRDDSLDDAVVGVSLQLFPQTILVQLGADRRAALVAGIAVAYFLGCQGEIVEAGFGSDLDAISTGFPQQGDSFHRREVNDVQRQIGGKMSQR
jgi:hypothetical protein